MLVIGSRALRRSFKQARAARDWDLVGTPEDLEALRGRLEPLRGLAWSRSKAFFFYQGNVMEFIVAHDGSAWRDVLALPSEETTLPLVGPVRFASAETLHLLKSAHAHLSGHWWKTTADLAFLRSRSRLQGPHAALLPLMRTVAEGYKGARACAFGDPRQVLDADLPASAVIAWMRLHRGLGNVLGAYVDASRPGRATSLPATRAERKALLVELAAVYAFMECSDDVPTVTPAREREIWNVSLEILCTRVLGRDLRICLAPEADDARRSFEPGFLRRVSRLADAASPAGLAHVAA